MTSQRLTIQRRIKRINSIIAINDSPDIFFASELCTALIPSDKQSSFIFPNSSSTRAASGYLSFNKGHDDHFDHTFANGPLHSIKCFRKSCRSNLQLFESTLSTSKLIVSPSHILNGSIHATDACDLSISPQYYSLCSIVYSLAYSHQQIEIGNAS
ncbi:hypothetical protein FGO68_gene2696 [Halteria grandinella]|uniref:Uncharacterized protein n=1 Tax=Halteria grandinella TaxID=5974 RepID=A0A8J8T1M0_HALGN|nr:hypothetical protein FGO68_gene2696 [Halteria grandinella]